MSDELDAEAQRELLAELLALRDLLASERPSAAWELPLAPTSALHSVQATAVEPPLLHEVVDHDDDAIAAEPEDEPGRAESPSALHGADAPAADNPVRRPASVPGANQDSDWAQFIDHVFAKEPQLLQAADAPPTAVSSTVPSTASADGDEDALMIVLTQQLDERLQALRGNLLGELRDLIARRRGAP